MCCALRTFSAQDSTSSGCLFVCHTRAHRRLLSPSRGASVDAHQGRMSSCRVTTATMSQSYSQQLLTMGKWREAWEAKQGWILAYKQCANEALAASRTLNLRQRVLELHGVKRTRTDGQSAPPCSAGYFTLRVCFRNPSPHEVVQELHCPHEVNVQSKGHGVCAHCICMARPGQVPAMPRTRTERLRCLTSGDPITNRSDL